MRPFLGLSETSTSSTPLHDRTHLCYIALGSNLNNPVQQLLLALEGLSEVGELISNSSFYRSAPMEGGPEGQADYINAVASVRTGLSARQLLKGLQEIERNHGREKHVRWEARPIDLDIISYEDLVLEEAGLVIPHPGIMSRSFVLVPLAEIAPDWVHPIDGIKVDEAIHELGEIELEKLQSPS